MFDKDLEKEIKTKENQIKIQDSNVILGKEEENAGIGYEIVIGLGGSPE